MHVVWEMLLIRTDHLDAPVSASPIRSFMLRSPKFNEKGEADPTVKTAMIVTVAKLSRRFCVVNIDVRFIGEA